MNFAEHLTQMPDIAHLAGIEIYNENNELIHTIPAIEGKLGSLKLYHALAQQFPQLNADAATQGLTWFAEHVADAIAHPSKHPNIDLLLNIQQNQLVYQIKLQLK